ncbi:hypothetical protein [Roseibacillus ishigakijimensis]|uniref:Uncharacterized protein n=1 Tax=Roseibacillus ishigakijimensis TaxID=454146 RepID=A0A934VGE9_9BACT|nr:hypothetical protein [Roseibacillus ishigakijimensis]MBK1832788.1 hypothetical protein [Roseibacillus ishigakijimensis]
MRSFLLLGLLLVSLPLLAQLPPSLGLAPSEPLPDEDVEAALYVTGWEVILEIVAKPLPLQNALGLGWDPAAPITPAQRALLAEKATVHFADHSTLLLDGEPAKLITDSVQFITPDKLTPETLPADALVRGEDFRIMVQASVPLPSLQTRLTLNWHQFPPGQDLLPLRVADSIGSRAYLLTPDSPELTPDIRLASNLRDTPPPPPQPGIHPLPLRWILLPLLALLALCLLRKLWKPALLVVLLGLLALLLVTTHNARSLQKLAHQVSDEEGKEITDRILEGVYHAFNFTSDEQQYDVLAQVLAEPALTETFLETNRTVEARKRGGSQVRVQNVTVEALTASPLPDGKAGFLANCLWRTRGQVGHWGHFHDRSNFFTAELHIEIVAGRWKATAIDLQNRIRE